MKPGSKVQQGGLEAVDLVDSLVLKMRWKAGCHLRFFADQPWNGQQLIKFGRWRKWKGWGQVRIPVRHQCRVRWMKRCPGRPSHIGTAGLDRTEASSEQIHQHHKSSEVDRVGSRDLWCWRTKAVLRSSDTRSKDSPWLAESLILLSRVSRAVSVKWQFRYADWGGL